LPYPTSSPIVGARQKTTVTANPTSFAIKKENRVQIFAGEPDARRSPTLLRRR
jgi:hypothetical protein